MKKQTQKKNEKQKATENEKRQEKTDKRVVDLSDLELKHVVGGLSFCTTPWD